MNRSILPLFPSRRASPHFGRYSFSVPLRVEGWLGLSGWLKPNSITLAGSKLVRSWSQAGSKLVGDQLRTSYHHTTTVLRPFIRDHPGEPVPEENFWTLWCKGRLTEADTPTIRLSATSSGLASQCSPPPSPYFDFEPASVMEFGFYKPRWFARPHTGRSQSKY